MKKNTRKGFIYFRYILPIFTAILTLVLMSVPCYRFVTADTGLNKAISCLELMSNSWDTVRDYLFGNGEQVQVTADFAGTVFGLIILSVLLFAIGLASAVYAAVTAFGFFKSGCKESRARILFVTLVPNRVVLVLYYALMLPLLFFPRIMPALYDGILRYHVELICQSFDILIVDGIIFALTVAVIFISARYESLCEMNVFIRYKSQESDEEDDTVSDGELDDSEDAYAAMDRKTREEQNERILRLLNRAGQEQNGDSEQENE